MSETKRNLEEALFDLAIQKSHPAERAAFLDGACRDNPVLRARLDLMLEGHFAGAGFLTRISEREDTETQAVAPELGTATQMIGRYKLLEVIGEGGFGEVWMAEQREPVKRRVALKIIKLGMDSRQIVARFEAERQALALMDHPNIARIFDAGTTDAGRPYFVMELVRGLKITDYCDQNQLPTVERLKLFIQVCQAVQHAHQKGIIHRDIKPSNILVTLHDGVPVPKVIDFGIAKATQQELTDKTVFTQFQQFIGTPAYISPEQAEMSGLDIDTRADIYSLGVLLYELLVGQTPFDVREMMKGGLDAMRQIIREREPQRPSTRLGTLTGEDRTTASKRRQTEPAKLLHQLRGDLDWIVMKCLEKDRSRRYDTANGLAMDIQRHLANEPVDACPPSKLYEFQKTVQRHKFGFAAAAAIMLVLATGIALTSWQAMRATRARAAAERAAAAEQAQRLQTERKQKEVLRAQQRAENSEARVSDLLYGANLNLVQVAAEENNFRRARQLLDETGSNPKRGFEWYYWQRQLHRESRILRGHVGAVLSVAYSPDGRRLATGGDDGKAIVWDTATGGELCRIRGEQGVEGIRVVAFSPDGERILSTSGWEERGLRVHNAGTGAELLALSRVQGGSFSPDGRRIVTLRGDQAMIWDSVTGQELTAFKAATPFSDQFAKAVVFSPDGQSIFAPFTGPRGTQIEHSLDVLDAATGERRLTLPVDFHSMAISPDGGRVATVKAWGGDPSIWDVAHPDQAAGMLVGGGKRSIQFSSDGLQLLTGGDDQTARLWDSKTLGELRVFRGHTAGIRGVAFSPKGRFIATASEDGTARIWDLSVQDGPLIIQDPEVGGPGVVVVSPNGRWLASTHDSSAVLWDVATGRPVHRLTVYTPNPDRRREWAENSVNAVSFSPDSQRLVAAGNNYVALVFDVQTGQKVATLNHSSTNVDARSVQSAAFSPDGQRIVTTSFNLSRSGRIDKPVRIWDAPTGRLLSAITEKIDTIPDACGALFTPDGQRLIATGQTAAGVWDAGSGKFLFPLPGGGLDCCRSRPLALSTDGKLLATALGDLGVRIWDTTTFQPLIDLLGHKEPVTSAGFSPDGARLVTGSDDRTAKVWDIRTGQEVLTLKGHQVSVRSTAFFPDGRRILTSSWDGTIRIWDAATDQQVATWQKETETAATLLAARTTELEKANEARRLGQDRKHAAMAKARADGAAAKVDLAREAADPGAIKQWLVLAPIRTEGRDPETRLDEEQLPGEPGLHPHPGAHIRVVGNYDDSEERTWTAVRQDDYRIDLKRIINHPVDTMVGYLVTYLVSESDRPGLLMKVGSDYHAKIYLNGKLVHEKRSPTSFEPDRDKVEGIQLQAGVNVLVFKIVQSGPAWGGSVWITDTAGQPVKGLRVTLDPDDVK